MKTKFLYESHLGGCFWSDKELTYEQRFCEECCDIDYLVGKASNIDEAKKLIDDISHPFRDLPSEDLEDEEDREFCQYTDEHIKELLEEFER